jgi:hypothetical protein
MTRKDYQKLASAIASSIYSQIHEHRRAAQIEIVESIAVALKLENQAFNYYKFFKACGLTDEEQENLSVG